MNAMIIYKKQLCCMGILGSLFPMKNQHSQVLTFLGFVLNSVTMTVQLTESRKKKLKNACLNLVNEETCGRGNWADSVKFSMGGTCPLYYRSLERDKSNALRGNKGKFWISFLVLERNWWISSVDTSHKLISYGVPELHIQTDSSAHCWGGQRGEQRTGGDGTNSKHPITLTI